MPLARHFYDAHLVFFCLRRLTHSWEFQWRPMAVGGSHACNFKQAVLVHGPFQPQQLEQIWDKTQVNKTDAVKNSQKCHLGLGFYYRTTHIFEEKLLFSNV